MINKMFSAVLIFTSVIISTISLNAAERDSLPSVSSVDTAVHEWTAPLMITRNRLFTYVSLNDGKRKLFFIDNGWSQTTVDSHCIKAVEFNKNREVIFHAMDKRNLSEWSGTIPKLAIGEFAITKPEIRVSELLPTISKKIHRKVHGIFACEPMHSMLTTFDFKNKKIIFNLHREEKVAELLSQKGIIALPYGPHPLSATANHIFSVKIMINNAEVDALVDLGFSGGILTSLSTNDLGINGARHRQGKKIELAVAGYKGDGYLSQAKKVSIGDYSQRNVPFICFTSESAPKFALLGVDYLKKYRVTFNFRDKMLYLLPM